MSGLSNPRVLFGVHSLSPYSRVDGTPYGMLKVIGSAAFALSSSLQTLYAGSNKFPWAAESKTIATDLTCKVKAYPDFLFQLFLGASVTDADADTSGTITTPVNIQGSSAISATIGIATVTVKSADKANLKFGKYLIKVLTSTTVALYLLSDIDINRGATTPTYNSDGLDLALSTITIVSGTGTDITSIGLTLTGGSGSIGMTVGDTASFEVSPLSNSSSTIIIGQSTTTFPAFSALILAQKLSDGEMCEIDAYNVVGTGLPISFEELAFSQPELKMTLLYDSVQNAVCKIRTIVPTSGAT